MTSLDFDSLGQAPEYLFFKATSDWVPDEHPRNEDGTFRHAVVVTGFGMSLSGTVPEMKTQARHHLLGSGNIRGEVKISADDISVLIERDGIKEAIRRAKDKSSLLVIAHVPELLSGAYYWRSERKDKVRGESIIAYHHYYALATLDGDLLLVHLPVEETDRGHLFYDCRTTEEIRPTPDSATHHITEVKLQLCSRRASLGLSMAEFHTAVKREWDGRIAARLVTGRSAESFLKSWASFGKDYDSLCKSANYLTRGEVLAAAAQAVSRIQPIEAQLKAGNYSKRKVSWQTPDLKLSKAEFTSTFRLVLFHSFGKLQNEYRTTKKLDRGAFQVRTQPSRNIYSLRSIPHPHDRLPAGA